METLDLSPAGRAPVAEEAPKPTVIIALDSFRAEPTECRAFGGLSWTFRNGFGEVLAAVPQRAWSEPAAQGWELVKRNSTREVWRAELHGHPFYVKYYFERGWRDTFKRAVRGPACRIEWRGGIYAIRHGLAAVRPAGFVEGVHCGGRRCSILVTEAVEPAYPLDEFWMTLRTDEDSRRRRRDTQALADGLADLIARAHQCGFEHLDMHPANILLRPIGPGRYVPVLVDLQSARLGVAVTDRAVVQNLAQLNQWFRRHSSVMDRIRFLRAYFRRRNEYEARYEHGRRLDLPFEELVRALARRADVHGERIWSQRDRRARREGRYFARVKPAPAWRGMVFVQSKRTTEGSAASSLVLDRAWWKKTLARPLHWFEQADRDIRKDSHSAQVVRTFLETPGGPLAVIIKRPLARDRLRSLRSLLPPSRAWRGWAMGHALLHRDLPAARPLAVLERKRGPLIGDSVLITEFISASRDLEDHLRAEHASLPPRQWREHKNAIIQLLVRELRRLQERGFAHRDCKARNILIQPRPEGPTLYWIDMDGIRHVRRLSPQERLRPLLRLHVSLVDVPGLTRTDRIRFLKAYLAGFGADPRAWRGVYRRLGAAADRKLAELERRKAWKREHYGRE
ncbi:MAG: hypothetical protein AMXMBFR47_12220 [Planctomycetota bacterium]